jgi:hypothetical protein
MLNIIMLSVFMLNVIMLSVSMLCSRYAGWQYACGHCAVIIMLNVIMLRCRSAQYCYTECHYAE